MPEKSIRTAVAAAMFILAATLCLFADNKGANAPLFADNKGANAPSLLVMDNGRIKPLGVYARYTLFELSGRYSCGASPAIDWLCRVLFSPQEALADPVFLINDPAVADAIGIPPAHNRRYSLRSLLPALDRLESAAMIAHEMNPADRSGVENELLRVYLNVRKLLSLSGTLSFAASPPDSGTRTIALAMIPLEENGGIVWHDPLDMQATDSGRTTMDPVLVDLREAHEALVRHDTGAYAARLRSANGVVRERLARHGIYINPEVELFYTALDPFFRAQLAYIASLLLLIAGGALRKKWIVRTGALALAAGLTLHTAGLILRMIIMHRAPVATFYETFVFVAWAGVLLGLLAGAVLKRNHGLFIAAFMGSLFLSFATRFSAGGDTMGMLAPVLNSNFWLSLHIITIATGYAGCLAAGVFGHLLLLEQALPGQWHGPLPVRTAGQPGDSSLHRAMWIMLASGLTFTTIGTVLGGMWAEQAWGRFWGWDPKENGALLIILWCAILLHARSAGFLKRCGEAFGVAACVPLVMLAWVGVNLLGIGMHSYGFTAVGAKVLFGVLGADAVFMAVIAVRLLFIRHKS